MCSQLSPNKVANQVYSGSRGQSPAQVARKHDTVHKFDKDIMDTKLDSVQKTLSNGC